MTAPLLCSTCLAKQSYGTAVRKMQLTRGDLQGRVQVFLSIGGSNDHTALVEPHAEKLNVMIKAGCTLRQFGTGSMGLTWLRWLRGAIQLL